MSIVKVASHMWSWEICKLEMRT